jgi:hypothetical protein
MRIDNGTITVNYKSKSKLLKVRRWLSFESFRNDVMKLFGMCEEYFELKFHHPEVESLVCMRRLSQVDGVTEIIVKAKTVEFTENFIDKNTFVWIVDCKIDELPSKSQFLNDIKTNVIKGNGEDLIISSVYESVDDKVCVVLKSGNGVALSSFVMLWISQDIFVMGKQVIHLYVLG